MDTRRRKRPNPHHVSARGFIVREMLRFAAEWLLDAFLGL